MLGAQQIRSNFFGCAKVLAPQNSTQRIAAPRSSLQVQAGRIGPGKLWEHYDLTRNNKPVRNKMHIKAGDLVKVIAGSDKGKIGTIKSVNTKTGQVMIEGVNIKTKHVKPTGDGEGGQIVKKEFPVHHSNVQVYSEASQVSSRVAHKVGDDGKKVRVLIKTGEVIDK